MTKDLPAFIDPVRLAQTGCVLQGQIAVAECSRIVDRLCSTAGQVSFEWLFTKNEQQRPIIQGWVKAPLQLLCQRCLKQMCWQVEAKVALVVLTEGQSDAHLPPGYEALVLTKTPVSLKTLIEDEIILALPIAAMHDVCQTNDYCLTVQEEEAGNDNPFQILKNYK